MNILTISIPTEAKYDVIGNNIIIEIPKECNRDLWKAQLEFWLENENKITDSGYLRVTNENNMKMAKFR